MKYFTLPAADQTICNQRQTTNPPDLGKYANIWSELTLNMQTSGKYENNRSLLLPWTYLLHLHWSSKHFLNMNNLMKTHSEHFASLDYWWIKHEKMFETPKIDKFDKVIVYPSKHTSCSCSLLLPQLSKNRQVLIFDDLLVKPVFVLKPSMYVNEFILNHSNCYSLFRTMHPVGLFIWLGI